MTALLALIGRASPISALLPPGEMAPKACFLQRRAKSRAGVRLPSTSHLRCFVALRAPSGVLACGGSSMDIRYFVPASARSTSAVPIVSARSVSKAGSRHV